MAATPLTDAEFAAALDPLLRDVAPAPLALAVSGGRDSLALMQLAAIHARARGRALLVLTVDHGLRAESASEAVSVAEAAGRLGLRHLTLCWRPGRLTGNLEAAAREARYRLMAEACAQDGVGTLLLGHTQDDQAETVLMRLARGSGVDGLSAMAPKTRRLGLTLLRPLLDIPRARLEARLKADGVAWHDDPMNEDPRFARVRLRRMAAALEEAGLTRARLAATARHMARARIALESAADALMAEAVTIAPEGYCRIDVPALSRAPAEIGLRLLARSLSSVGGLVYPLRFERLERLYDRIRAEGIGRGCTLGGCRILPHGANGLLIAREAAGLAGALPLQSGASMLWDGRFRVRLAEAALPGRMPLVRALGADGVRTLRQARPSAPLGQIPGPVRATLPSLWFGADLAAIPHLNYVAPGFSPWADGFTAEFAGL